MQTIPKKSIIIIFVAVLVYSLLFTLIAYAVESSDNRPSDISTDIPLSWKIGGVILSLYTLTTPWRRQKKFDSLASQQNVTSRQMWGILIVFCLAPCIAPLIYGLVLFFQGMSLIQFYFFAALSVVGTGVWSIYNLRRKM